MRMETHFLRRRTEQAIRLLRGEPERGRGEALEMEGKKERKWGEGKGASI